MLLFEPPAQIDEALGAHHVDVGKGAARERREAEAEDRAHVGLAHVGDDALLDAARGFQRLRHQQAVLELLDVDLVGVEFRRLQVGESRPQPLRAVLRIIVKTLAILAPEPAALLDQLLQQPLLLRVDRLGAEIGFHGLEDFPAEIERHLVVEREWPDRHARHARDILDHGRRHTLHQHQMAFADVIEHAAVGIEAARIVDHDRRLADGAHIVERDRERGIAGLFAKDDLDQHHALDRREEMHADEVRGAPGGFRERGDRQRRGVGGEHHVLADDSLRLGDGLGLDITVLEHRLDHEIATFQRAVVGGRRDAREHRVALGRGGAAAVDLVGHELLRMRLALVGGLLVTVDEHHREPGERGHIGDAAAHESGADDAHGLERGRRRARRPARALVELLHGDEQRADHAGRFRRAQDMREPARLDAQRLVDRQLQPLIDHLHDRARGRVVVKSLAPIDRVRRRKNLHPGLGIDRPAREPKTLHVPRRLRLAAGLDPVLGALDQVGRGHHGVDDLHALGLRQPDLVALEQKLQGIARRHDAGDALGAAGAGKEADLDLGQPDSRLRIVAGDAVMAGEAKLEAAAERGAVDGRDPRLAAGLDPTIEHGELAAVLVKRRDRRFLAARLGHVGELAAEQFQHGEIGAGAERLLA